MITGMSITITMNITTAVAVIIMGMKSTQGAGC